MIVHDFTHEWDGKSQSGEKPITWWPGAYRIRILRLGDPDQKVQFLFPSAVVFKSMGSEKGMNTALKNYVDNFAKKLAKKYELNIEKTLWVEWEMPPVVAQLSPDRTLGDDTLYSISWRPIRPNEEALILPDLEDF